MKKKTIQSIIHADKALDDMPSLYNRCDDSDSDSDSESNSNIIKANQSSVMRHPTRKKSKPTVASPPTARNKKKPSAPIMPTSSNTKKKIPHGISQISYPKQNQLYLPQ